MANLWTRTTAYRPTDDHLRYLAAGLAYLVAAIHIFHPKRGFPRLAKILTLDDPMQHLIYDPRPLLFVLSGIAIIVAIKLALFGFPRKPLYVTGMALMAAYFAGYFAWHLSGHGGFLPVREPHYHGLPPVEATVAHLRGYAWARWSKLLEALLFVVLAALFFRETE